MAAESGPFYELLLTDSGLPDECRIEHDEEDHVPLGEEDVPFNGQPAADSADGAGCTSGTNGATGHVAGDLVDSDEDEPLTHCIVK